MAIKFSEKELTDNTLTFAVGMLTRGSNRVFEKFGPDVKLDVGLKTKHLIPLLGVMNCALYHLTGQTAKLNEEDLRKMREMLSYLSTELGSGIGVQFDAVAIDAFNEYCSDKTGVPVEQIIKELDEMHKEA